MSFDLHADVRLDEPANQLLHMIGSRWHAWHPGLVEMALSPANLIIAGGPMGPDRRGNCRIQLTVGRDGNLATGRAGVGRRRHRVAVRLEEPDSLAQLARQLARLECDQFKVSWRARGWYVERWLTAFNQPLTGHAPAADSAAS